MPPLVHRRDLLRLACASLVAGIAACGGRGPGRAAPAGRLTARPRPPGRFGLDVEFLDRALHLVLTRYAVDPTRLAAEGFSDDLFTHIIAFSPGFDGRLPPGKAAVLRLHGVYDQVLPVDLCGRRAALEWLAGRG